MFKSFRLWLLEQQLKRTGKYEAYLNQVREKGSGRNYPECTKIARALLAEPEFSRMRSWAEYQRLKNAGR
jgi:hypothetical protein